MALQKFTLAALAELDDGRIAEQFMAAILRARTDCHERPAHDGKRTVKLIAHLTPVEGKNGNLGSVNIKFEVDDKLPKVETPTYNFVDQRGGLFFNALSPEDARQGTLDDAPRPGKKAAGGDA